MEYLQPTWHVSGMTCSFTEPEFVKTAWAFEAFKLIREFHVHLADLKEQVKRPALLKLTRKRLEGLITKVAEETFILEKLLEPLGWRQLQQSQIVSSLNENPGPSQLSANYDHLFRDWVWGNIENKASLDFVESVIADKALEGQVLVLGAGGCRLAYDFHRKWKPKKTVACDYNPLLMIIAQKIIHGESVELIEFPLMPSQGNFAAIKQSLKAPESVASEEFQFVLADATQPTFPRGSFETVLTPWLIDVVKQPLPDFLVVLNQILPLGGTWISFGPLGFNNSLLAAHYTLEEVKYLVEKSGFQIESEKYEMIPYMQNPSSNSHRLERVLAFKAAKVKEVETPATVSNGNTFTWKENPDAPIGIPLREMNLVSGHQFNADVLAMAQNENSFNQIVSHVKTKYGLLNEQAHYLVSQILYNAETLSHTNPLRR